MRCPLGFAIVAKKTRLQDFRAIFSFKAAALAVESDWATQG
ncbi:MAG: hypothetical protein SPE49_05295 [Campylobacter sp.]|nr:hypothetical protein [Campylobacter sp.]MDY5115364.1 hypothetical protein [Campylobacter sp.]